MGKAQAGRGRVEPGLRASLAFVLAVQVFTAESQRNYESRVSRGIIRPNLFEETRHENREC